MASIMEGPLSKWTNVMKGWQYRWFVLDYNAGLLSYYTSKDKMMRGSRRGCVRLRGAVIGIDDEDDSTFTITVDQKTFHFQGDTYTQTSTQCQSMQHASDWFRPSCGPSSSSEVGLTYFALFTAPEEEDCCLCVSAVQPLGIIREYC